MAQVEEYDTTEDTYNIVTELPRMIVMFGIAALGKKIYLVGGKDPLTCLTLDTVLVFDIEHNTWSTSFPSLREARSVYSDNFFTYLFHPLGTTALRVWMGKRPLKDQNGRGLPCTDVPFI